MNFAGPPLCGFVGVHRYISACWIDLFLLKACRSLHLRRTSGPNGGCEPRRPKRRSAERSTCRHSTVPQRLLKAVVHSAQQGLGRVPVEIVYAWRTWDRAIAKHAWICKNWQRVIQVAGNVEHVRSSYSGFDSKGGLGCWYARRSSSKYWIGSCVLWRWSSAMASTALMRRRVPILGRPGPHDGVTH